MSDAMTSSSRGDQVVTQLGVGAKRYVTLPVDRYWLSTLPTWLRFRTHGQDATGVAHLFPGGGQDEWISGVVDGHGTGGELWARESLMSLVHWSVVHWTGLKRLLRRRQVEQARQLIQSGFRDTEQRIIHRIGPKAYHGGSTASLTLVIIVRRRRYLIQAAVGDSPAGIAVDGVATPTVTEANGDNQQAVEEFHRRHQAAGVTTPAVIYSRIGTSHSPLQVEWPEGSGEYNTIPAWVYQGDQVRPNVEGYEAIRRQTGYYHGQQSRNYPPVYYREQDQAWVVRPGHEADNWGNSCVKGYGQNLTGFGDLISGLASDCDASVHIREEPRACLAYACSDGIGDLLPISEMAQQIQRLHRSGYRGYRLVQAWQDWIRTQINFTQEPQYAWTPEGYAYHDDCSWVSLDLPAWEPPARRRRHRQTRRRHIQWHLGQAARLIDTLERQDGSVQRIQVPRSIQDHC